MELGGQQNSHEVFCRPTLNHFADDGCQFFPQCTHTRYTRPGHCEEGMRRAVSAKKDETFGAAHA